DLREHVALLHVLPLGEIDAHELAVDAAAHDDRAHRHHGAQPAEIDRDIADLGHAGHDRDRASVRALAAALSGAPGLALRLRGGFAAAGLVVMDPGADERGRHHEDERYDQQVPPTRVHGAIHGESSEGPISLQLAWSDSLPQSTVK